LAFAHYALARVMCDRRRFGEAAEALKQAIEADSSQANFFSLLGAIRMEQRSWPSALEAANKALELDPQHPQATNIRAMALVQLGRRQEAAATLGDALARDPDNAVTHANQGWALLHRGEHRKAMEHFREALRLDPNSQWARSGIVEALKARNIIYRWLLMYFLWMNRLRGRAQWMIILGAYFGYRFALATLRTNPQLGPVLWPLVIGYAVFAVMTWFAVPLMNLLLRLHPFGRYALSRDQTLCSNWMGILLMLAGILLIVGLARSEERYATASIFTALMVIPICVLFACEKGWPRNLIIVATILLAGLGTAAVLLAFTAQNYPYLSDPRVALSGHLVTIFVYGLIATQLGSVALIKTRVRR
jgi:tetratricopeptide (TPR) repeat protein